MTPEVERIFDHLADSDAPARERYFALHPVDRAVRREVESLLAYDSSSNGSIMTPVMDMVATILPGLGTQTPEKCGPYELRELIGRGGMGAVYRAERVDGEVRQQVAVKLMHTSAGDPLQRQRFLQERQILATLQHPNIASLLDAGHTSDGQPYFVLELVDGERIDDFCDPLTIRQKIELFLKICDAVSFAHSRLVVHRDLKPGNILVTVEGEPKLLDFGIAKMLDIAGEDTVTLARVMTPAYGSPEQIIGGAVTTATDTYSLGAVLYRILTGHPPHTFENTTPDGTIAAICNRDVPRGSKWNSELAGDLDAILMKALRKEPLQRYVTVEQLADDLRSFLRFQPVRARQGEFLYRTTKFARRNWIPLAAAMVAVTALVIGLFVASYERELAERRFRTVRDLANNLFEVDNRVRSLQGSTAARQFIADSALRYLNQLSSEANERDLLLELGEAYQRTAEVLSSRGASSLGRDADALAALDQGNRLLQKAFVLRPNDRPALRSLIKNRVATLMLVSDKDRRKAIKSQAEDLGPLIERLAAGSPTSADLSLAATAYGVIRRALTNLNQIESSRHYAELSIEYSRRYAESSSTPDAFLLYGSALRKYATFLRYDGQLERAHSKLTEALRALGKVPEGKAKQIELSAVLYYIGVINGEADSLGLARPDVAIAALQHSTTISRQLMAADPKDHNARIDFVQSALLLAETLQPTKPIAALPLYSEAWDTMSAEPEGSFLRADYMVRLTSEWTFALRKVGRTAEAWQRLQRIENKFFKGHEQASMPIGPNGAEAAFLRAEAEMNAATGRPRDAIALYRRLLRGSEASEGYRPNDSLLDAVSLSAKQARLSQLLQQTGDRSEADYFAAEHLQLWKSWNRRLPNNTFVAQRLAEAELRANASASLPKPESVFPR